MDRICSAAPSKRSPAEHTRASEEQNIYIFYFFTFSSFQQRQLGGRRAAAVFPSSAVGIRQHRRIPRRARHPTVSCSDCIFPPIPGEGSRKTCVRTSPAAAVQYISTIFLNHGPQTASAAKCRSDVISEDAVQNVDCEASS